MEVVRVPGPAKAAFNKGRRISDLIRAQVNHLKHLEAKMPAAVRAGIPQHAIVTEEDAARYIAPMTRLLRGAGVAVAKPVSEPVSIESGRRPVRGVVDIAAAAESAPVTEMPAAGTETSLGAKAHRPSSKGSGMDPGNGSGKGSGKGKKT